MNVTPIEKQLAAVEALDRGMSGRAAGKAAGVNKSTSMRLAQRWRRGELTAAGLREQLRLRQVDQRFVDRAVEMAGESPAELPPEWAALLAEDGNWQEITAGMLPAPAVVVKLGTVVAKFLDGRATLRDLAKAIATEDVQRIVRQERRGAKKAGP